MFTFQQLLPEKLDVSFRAVLVTALVTLNLVISPVAPNNLKSCFNVNCCSGHRLKPTAWDLPIWEHFIRHFLIPG